MGTTGWPAWINASTIRPEGRSMAIGMVAAGAILSKRRRNSASPSAVWSMVKRATMWPSVSSMTQTAWTLPPQSTPQQ
jgi:hypothetical protein